MTLTLKASLFFLILGSLSVTICRAEDVCPAISLEEAESIAEELLKPRSYDTAIDDYQGPASQGFYSFEIVRRHPDEDHRYHVSWLQVNKFTGDLWDVSGDCVPKTSPAIRALQAKIRTNCPVPNQVYAKLRKTRPFCNSTVY